MSVFGGWFCVGYLGCGCQPKGSGRRARRTDQGNQIRCPPLRRALGIPILRRLNHFRQLLGEIESRLDRLSSRHLVPELRLLRRFCARRRLPAFRSDSSETAAWSTCRSTISSWARRRSRPPRTSVARPRAPAGTRYLAGSSAFVDIQAPCQSQPQPRRMPCHAGRNQQIEARGRLLAKLDPHVAENGRILSWRRSSTGPSRMNSTSGLGIEQRISHPHGRIGNAPLPIFASTCLRSAASQTA